jgi:hypothetical protein
VRDLTGRVFMRKPVADRESDPTLSADRNRGTQNLGPDPVDST